MEYVFSNLLLQLVFPVINGDGVVVSVKSMNQSLETQERFNYLQEVLCAFSLYNISTISLRTISISKN